VFIANEGSLEDEPLFHGGPYLYSIMLREPLGRLVSHFYFKKEWVRQFEGVDVKGYTLSRALLNNARNYNSKVDNYVTRRLCGVACLRSPEHAPPPLEEEHFVRALTMLEQFDVVMAMERLKDSLGLLARAVPQFGRRRRRAPVARRNPTRVGVSLALDLRTPELEQRARELCLMDFLLYERARQLLSHKLATFPAAPPISRSQQQSCGLSLRGSLPIRAEKPPATPCTM
jgi:hypothetical protein